MSDLIRKDASELAGLVSSGEVSAVEVAQAHLDRIAAVDGDVHAFLHVDTAGALASAAAVDVKVKAGDKLSVLAGVPLGLKDILATNGLPTTCGSRVLDGWIPPYDATVVTKLREAGVVILGKTNMDEFAMGSSTEHSAFGPTHNPWDLERIPGGSGGGSSACVSSFEAPLAIGTDTGGSIRQPAAVTGSVGVKPTYGGVSRYGIVALASSLDQAGPCARNVLDTALLHSVIAGHDPMDATSINAPVPDVIAAAKRADIKGMKVGIVKELGGEGYQAGVRSRFEESVALIESLGAEVVEVSCPSFPAALAAYYLILPSEASSNLAKFDGIRFGNRVGDDGTKSVEQVMSETRAAGFGSEVIRRIILGTYALSAGYYDAYYGQAQKVRTLIKQDFDAAFAKVDVLISPTAPTTAFKIGEKLDDPLAMYLNDVATIPVNMAGLPGMSLPIGLAPEDNLPVGLQIIAPAMADDRLYNVGAAIERELLAKWGGPILGMAPELAGA
ncbi:MAG: Asp-tRNA(Asn)/Glu-tRNA(Gln) amidotransferase subunit GatA [Actinobacteria bacterium]|nr:Asp-tRNA(Asn)/Glu-tRNA(Gln) amidotransferase subunit GatA [Actinomycetota bacterium]